VNQTRSRLGGALFSKVNQTLDLTHLSLPWLASAWLAGQAFRSQEIKHTPGVPFHEEKGRQVTCVSVLDPTYALCEIIALYDILIN
jgi:hypothetical protein